MGAGGHQDPPGGGLVSRAHTALTCHCPKPLAGQDLRRGDWKRSPGRVVTVVVVVVVVIHSSSIVVIVIVVVVVVVIR